MKKMMQLLMAALCVLLLSGCGCQHEWTDADCVNPKTCTLCQQAEGEALGHSWQEAACESAKTCTACGATEGETLGHSWQEAACETAKTCTTCGKTEGEAVGHTVGHWAYADGGYTGTCEVCHVQAAATPEEHIRQAMAGTWDADLLVQNVWNFQENPGHQITLQSSGDGVLSCGSEGEYVFKMTFAPAKETENGAGKFVRYDFTMEILNMDIQEGKFTGTLADWYEREAGERYSLNLAYAWNGNIRMWSFTPVQ